MIIRPIIAILIGLFFANPAWVQNNTQSDASESCGIRFTRDALYWNFIPATVSLVSICAHGCCRKDDQQSALLKAGMAAAGTDILLQIVADIGVGLATRNSDVKDDSCVVPMARTFAITEWALTVPIVAGLAYLGHRRSFGIKFAMLFGLFASQIYNAAWYTSKATS